jgi:hypothetical protein
VTLNAAYLTGDRFAAGVGTASFDVGSAGATATITVPLSRKIDGDVAVVLSTLIFDTDRPVSDGLDHCYDPASGWHPRRIAVSLGAPALSDDGTTVSVDVSAKFAAGNSLEDERQCVDEINELAVAGFTVGVTAIAGDLTVESQEIAQGATYDAGNIPFHPDEQPEPAATALTIGAGDAIFGWTNVDYTFHASDPDDRGAYPRSIAVLANADAGVASGHSSNYSPGTQLSGFEYAFAGTVTAIASPGATVVRGAAAQEIPVELDENGDPVLQTLAF